MTIRRRILLFALLCGIAVATPAVLTYRNASSASEQMQQLAEQSVPSTLLLLNIDRDGYQAQLAAERAAFLPEGDLKAEFLDGYVGNSQQTKDKFADFTGIALGIEGEAELVANYQSLNAQWRATTEAFLAAPTEEGLVQSRADFEVMRNDLDVLEEMLYEAETARHLLQLQGNFSDQATTSLLILALVTALGVPAVWIITRSIDRSVGQSSSSVSDASRQIQAMSTALEGGATDTLGQAIEVSDAAGTVSRSVGNVSDALTELTLSIREIAENASRASSVAAQAVEQASETNQTVALLGDSSTEIGQVIDVITSIAEQTNLLALNATIEAARAGDAGKGFAVVANEVKELAKQTSSATDQISDQISAIQGDTARSVDAIDKITTVISEIFEIQTSIAAAVEEQTATTSEIARSADDAVSGSEEIANIIKVVADSARDSADEIELNRLSAEQLGVLAEELEQLVGSQTVERLAAKSN